MYVVKFSRFEGNPRKQRNYFTSKISQYMVVSTIAPLNNSSLELLVSPKHVCPVTKQLGEAGLNDVGCEQNLLSMYP